MVDTKATATERAFLKQFGFLNPEDYFDIHSYKTREEIFPGEWIYGNIQNKLDEIGWTIRDQASDGRFVDNINARQEIVAKVSMSKIACLIPFKEVRLLTKEEHADSQNFRYTPRG